MSLQPNRRVSAIQESTTLAIAARAKALKAAGQDVISLSAGEPDFETIPEVSEAGIRAIREGQTRYTAAAGTPELRAAASSWFSRSFGLDYGPDEVMASAGAKPGIHMALMSLLEDGDVVLLLAPYWVSYPALVHCAGGRPVDLPPVPENGFVHTGDQVAAAAAEHGAKGIILNYPNNPSGAAPSRTQMEELVDAALDAGMWIISDEIYAMLLYDGKEHVSPASFGKAREHVVIVNGGTKSHALTGWRIGFLAGPSEIVKAAARLQSQVIGNPSSISQAACIEVCTGNHEKELAHRLAAYDERRRYLVDEVNKLPGLELAPPSGAFYALVDARQLCEQRGVDDLKLSEQILQEVKVAVVPGSAFAIPGFIRLSYAASMEELKGAMSRLRDFVG